jgi:hypothetical protein
VGRGEEKEGGREGGSVEKVREVSCIARGRGGGGGKGGGREGGRNKSRSK